MNPREARSGNQPPWNYYTMPARFRNPPPWDYPTPTGFGNQAQWHYPAPVGSQSPWDYYSMLAEFGYDNRMPGPSSYSAMAARSGNQPPARIDNRMPGPSSSSTMAARSGNQPPADEKNKKPPWNYSTMPARPSNQTPVGEKYKKPGPSSSSTMPTRSGNQPPVRKESKNSGPLTPSTGNLPGPDKENKPPADYKVNKKSASYARLQSVSEPVSEVDLASQNCQFCLNSMLLLKKHRGPATQYLDDEALTNLNVECTKINFRTGEPTDDGSKMFLLPSLDEIKELTTRNNLNHPSEIVESEQEGSKVAYERSATFVGMMFESCLELYDAKENLTMDEAEPQTPLEEYGLKLRLPRKPESLCWGSTDMLWDVKYIIEPFDKSKPPHATCFLADSTERKEDSLCFSELWSILMITCGRHLRRTENGLPPVAVIPINVVSCSRRKVRIVQGVVESGCICIRKTPIMDFDDGRDVIWDNWRTILAWFLSSPAQRPQEC